MTEKKSGSHQIKSTTNLPSLNTQKNRMALILCVAENYATFFVLDHALGFSTHKIHEVNFDIMEQISTKEFNIIKSHQLLYINALSVESKFKFVSIGNLYHKDYGMGVKVVAKSRISNNEILQNLGGTLCTVDDSFIKTYPSVESFLVRTMQKKQQKLWLGPAAFINHGCKNNNVVMNSLDANSACVKATRVIEPGEEIILHYGENYFSSGECSCTMCSL
ncbi:SET domain [Cinara cedri]|uniref:SET domain n=1 Tax=Cinara cedri TaxID=506608 RepID=A0A5E4NS62_9HEMI|nr:SET domain [Cinara cedri]